LLELSWAQLSCDAFGRELVLFLVVVAVVHAEMEGCTVIVAPDQEADLRMVHHTTIMAGSPFLHVSSC